MTREITLRVRLLTILDGWDKHAEWLSTNYPGLAATMAADVRFLRRVIEHLLPEATP